MTSPLDGLAARARALVELVDSYSELALTELAPTGEKGSPDRVDPFEEVRLAALEVIGEISAARVEVWRELIASGMRQRAVAGLWGVSEQQVSKKVSGRG